MSWRWLWQPLCHCWCCEKEACKSETCMWKLLVGQAINISNLCRAVCQLLLTTLTQEVVLTTLTQEDDLQLICPVSFFKLVSFKVVNWNSPSPPSAMASHTVTMPPTGSYPTATPYGHPPPKATAAAPAGGAYIAGSSLGSERKFTKRSLASLFFRLMQLIFSVIGLAVIYHRKFTSLCAPLSFLTQLGRGLFLRKTRFAYIGSCMTFSVVQLLSAFLSFSRSFACNSLCSHEVGIACTQLYPGYLKAEYSGVF